MTILDDARAAGAKTGWPPGMLQDDDSKLSKWLATRPDSRMLARLAVGAIKQERAALKEANHGL